MKNQINFHDLPEVNTREAQLTAWLIDLAQHYQVEINRLVYNFIDKNQMLVMNQNFLNHDTHTDILTFSYSENEINTEVYISVDALKENALKFSQTIEKELFRLLSHGFLHAVGFNDKTENEKQIMTEQEDLCINLFHVKH